jgi:hypothetical protein
MFAALAQNVLPADPFGSPAHAVLFGRDANHLGAREKPLDADAKLLQGETSIEAGDPNRSHGKINR